MFNYANTIVPADTFAAGETIRLDPANGNLSYATGSGYTYDGGTGDAVIDYSNLATVTAGGYAVGETVRDVGLEHAFPGYGIGNQLKMIARLIAARGPTGFNMSRQIFFCSVGGYDTHTNQVTLNANGSVNPITGAHANLLGEVSDCVFAFHRAMEQLGIGNLVTTFTASDFARTLPTNSQGSDHGWGSHHTIVGGAVNGGATYGRLPVFAINGPNDTGLGRWIPTTAVDQHAATLARWFGVDEPNLGLIFPNLSRFTSGNLGFML